MLSFDVRGNVQAIEKHLSSLAKEQIPFATALALTRTAKFAEQKIKEEMPRVFKAPTRFTLNSTYVWPARKNHLVAEVQIKDERFKAIPANKWLMPQITGGSRTLKRSEKLLQDAGRMPKGTFLVPASGAELDGYGNVKRGMLQRMLADLQSHFDVLQNTTDKSRKRRLGARKRRPTFYFSTWPVNNKTAHLRPGIYRRTHFAWGAPIKPVFIFVKRVRYRRRLRFYEIADQSARMRFPIEFALAAKRAIATAR